MDEPRPERVKASAGGDGTSRFADSMSETTAAQAAVGRAIGHVVKPTLDRLRQVSAAAAAKLQPISALSEAQRANPWFVRHASETQKVHGAAVSHGISSMASGGMGGLRLTLSPSETEAISGKPAASAVAHLSTLLSRQGLTLDLQRVHSLNEAVSRWVGSSYPASGAGEQQKDSSASVSAEPPAPTTDPQSAAPSSDQLKAAILSRIAGQIEDMESVSAGDIGSRPNAADVSQAVADLTITGGPADVTAFEDVDVLELAFPDVWAEAFDKVLQGLGEELYSESVKYYESMGLQAPDLETVEDITTLNDFVSQVSNETGLGATSAPSNNSSLLASLFGFQGPSVDPGCASSGLSPIPTDVLRVFAGVAGLTVQTWNMLNDTQRLVITQQAEMCISKSVDEDQAWSIVSAILLNPQGSGSRLAKLLSEFAQMMSEPYSFKVFAPDTYNFGVLLTYRQAWEPLGYQAGKLVSALPLAPGETRKYTRRTTTRKEESTHSQVRTSDTRSTEDTELQSAESQIMQKASLSGSMNTSFSAGFSIDIVDIKAGAGMSADQSQESQDMKKEMHEATLKAAEEYRQEHSLEVEASAGWESEESYSGEISNPNNEITVTYLFYELQRRYDVTEQLQRARAVILVAQRVPRPDEVDEAWLVANSWPIGRVLLDESLRPALQYLCSGFAGDDTSLQVLEAQWRAQSELLHNLEASAVKQQTSRDTYRQALLDAMKTAGNASATASEDSSIGWTLATGGLSQVWGQDDKVTADDAEVGRRVAEMRLQYAEDALRDVQSKLNNQMDAYQRATQDYAAALRNKYSRVVAIDQLRIHVKQNILYYMKAIWASEPADQRFFRLCDIPVAKLEVDPNAPSLAIAQDVMDDNVPFYNGEFKMPPPCVEGTVNLAEVADLDNPLGFKGNYMIFPLKVPTYLTTYMLQQYVDDYFGVRDPDGVGNWPLKEVRGALSSVSALSKASESALLHARETQLEMLHSQIVSSPRPSDGEVTVPTGQLFIEALPGVHPLLEDFKLRHRLEDVKRAVADVRSAELENLRFAARLVDGELGDPQVDKTIVIDKAVGLSIDPSS
jgi:hypothetical protein